MDAELAELLAHATAGPSVVEDADDPASVRILDAALHEAAAAGLRRLTLDDVARRAGVGRMTLYRRFPRRDDLVRALVQRETQRFLAAVADGIDRADDVREGVAEAFVAAVAFARVHPILRRVADTDPGTPAEVVAADGGALLKTGAAFIARQIHGDRPGTPARQVRWVADVLARLFVSYVSIPPADPSPADDAELRRFAHEVLTPLVARAAAPSASAGRPTRARARPLSF